MRRKIFLLLCAVLLLCTPVKAASIYGNELLIDTGFESMSTDYNVGGSATWRQYYNYDTAYAEITDTEAHSGRKSIRFVNAGYGTGRGMYYVPNLLATASPGDVYEFSGYFKTDCAGGTDLYIRNSWENFSGSPVRIGNEWTEVKAVYTVPNGVLSFVLHLSCNLTMPQKISDYSNDLTAFRNAIHADSGVSYVYADDISFKKIIGNVSGAKSIVSNNGVSAVIDGDDKLWMWGDNTFKQINAADIDYFDEPYCVAEDIKKVACGDGHTVVLTTDNKVYGWGRNDFCQISEEKSDYISSPYLMAEDAKDISAGDDFSVYVDFYDVLYGRGRDKFNSYASGGDSDTWTRTYTDVKAVEAAGAQTFVIDNKGDLYGTGYNANGQLGMGNYLSPYRFKKIMSNVIQVSAADDYTLAVNSSNELYGFGWNKYGYLGDNIINTNIPIKIASNIYRAGAGEKVASLIKTDGTLLKMGGSDRGQFNSAQSGTDILCDEVTAATGDENILLLKNGKVLYYNDTFREIELFLSENEVYTLQYDGHTDGSFKIKIPAVRDAEVVSAIIAYYSDGKLTGMQNRQILSIRDCTLEITPDENSDMCKIMLWDSLSGMIPKTDSIDIRFSSIVATGRQEGDTALITLSGQVTGAGLQQYTEDDGGITFMVREKGTEGQDGIAYIGQTETDTEGAFFKNIKITGNMSDYYIKAYVFDKYIESEIVEE